MLVPRARPSRDSSLVMFKRDLKIVRNYPRGTKE